MQIPHSLLHIRHHEWGNLIKCRRRQRVAHDGVVDGGGAAAEKIECPDYLYFLYYQPLNVVRCLSGISTPVINLVSWQRICLTSSSSQPTTLSRSSAKESVPSLQNHFINCSSTFLHQEEFSCHFNNEIFWTAVKYFRDIVESAIKFIIW